MNPTTRLRIATRIHFALRRHFNEDVSVGSLLENGADTQEVLWVFEASGTPELVALAAQFREAFAGEAAWPGAASAGASLQDTGWSQNTTGFGVSLAPDFSDSQAGPTASSASAEPVSWLRRQSLRSRR